MEYHNVKVLGGTLSGFCLRKLITEVRKRRKKMTKTTNILDKPLKKGEKNDR